MKKTAAIISACMLTFALSACSGPNYVMHTNDGRSIVTDGKPQTDNDTGMISYKDANGNKQQINRTDVKEMVGSGKLTVCYTKKSTAIWRCYINHYGQTG